MVHNFSNKHTGTDTEIKKYIRQVKKVFPFCTRREKIYLLGLAQDVSDFYSEQTAVSISDIYKTFGTPGEIQANYLRDLSISEIDTHIIHLVNIKRFLIFCLILFWISGIIFSYYEYQKMTSLINASIAGWYIEIGDYVEE